jgi:hypothetical protein
MAQQTATKQASKTTTVKDTVHKVTIQDIRDAGQIFAEHRRFLEVILENAVTINNLQQAVDLFTLQVIDLKTKVAIKDEHITLEKEKFIAAANKHEQELTVVKKQSNSARIVAGVAIVTSIVLLVK